MSRNICATHCEECGHHEVVFLEDPRPITKEDFGPYKQFEGMLVAKSECPECGTLYMAWVDGSRMRGYKRSCSYGQKYFDLSYFHAFNDEPSTVDLPVWDTKRDRPARLEDHSYAYPTRAKHMDNSQWEWQQKKNEEWKERQKEFIAKREAAELAKPVEQRLEEQIFKAKDLRREVNAYRDAVEKLMEGLGNPKGGVFKNLRDLLGMDEEEWD